MSIHTNPRQCLANLTLRLSDGGREEFLERELFGIESEVPTGDCVIVALVYATHKPPTGKSYEYVKSRLSGLLMSMMYKDPGLFKRRRKHEGRIEFLRRRFNEWRRASNHNPIHETPSEVTETYLRVFSGYKIICTDSKDRENRWYCICDNECTYVLDVVIPGGGHTMTVHQRVAYTTARFDPGETEVVNVYGLSPEGTKECKAQRAYAEAEERWLDEQMQGDLESTNWDSGPKLEDYLGN